MIRLFFDTSAIYAYINRKDPYHSAVGQAVCDDKTRLVITNYIFDEIVTLVNVRLGHNQSVVVGNILMNAPEIECIHVNKADELAAWQLFCSRSDKGYSFTDCTSFVIMRRMNITAAIALDEHFQQEGFEMVVKKGQ